jgi:hypothetical protein
VTPTWRLTEDAFSANEPASRAAWRCILAGSRDSAVDQIWLPVQMLKAYIDDSNMNQGPVAVLAGWIAPPTKWARLVADWDAVLRMKPRVRYFKWKEARGLSGEFGGISEPRRDEKLNLLIDVLALHNPLGVSSVMSNELHREFFGENRDKILRGPYFLSFYSIVVQLVEFVGKNAPRETIDFTFDIQPGQMEAAADSWERLREAAPPEIRAIIGRVSFHDDVDVVPLQAADLSAGWTRESAEISCFGGDPPEPPWGNRGNSLRCLTRTWTEEIYLEFANKSGFPLSKIARPF